MENSRSMLLIHKTLYSLRTYGLRLTWYKTLGKLHNLTSYARLAKQPLFSEDELARQRDHVFPQKIRFSIVVPLYNTPERYLREMIESVQAQTYAGWELCMADGSDAEHADVERISREYAEKDSRIRYRKLEKNLGISGNTNACLEMAGGDYVGLFDHDDLLHPAALYEVMWAICELDADFIYTDEAVFFGQNRNNITSVHFKPDFAPDNLRANNYICHFCVFSIKLLKRAGVFRSEYDGSQDHDLILRLTEKAACIAHIPEILYYWRAHPGSVAQDITAKSYAVEAGKKAVADSVSRAGYAAQVNSSPVFPAIYNVQYELISQPRLSILLPVRNLAQARDCLSSILQKSSYPDYEILMIVDGCEPEDSFAPDQSNPAVHVFRLPAPCSHPACINLAAKHAAGEYLVLVDESVEVITPDWMEQLLMYTQRRDVAAAGAILYDERDRIKVSGTVLGYGREGIAGDPFEGMPKSSIGYMGRLAYAQNCSAVSAACMMVRADLFHAVKGMDERLPDQYYGLDLCLKLRGRGYLIIWTPHAEMRCKTKGKKKPRFEAEESRTQSKAERALFCSRWKRELDAGDPYYNPNFTLTGFGFSVASKIGQHKAKGTRENSGRGFRDIH